MAYDKIILNSRKGRKLDFVSCGILVVGRRIVRLDWVLVEISH